MTSHFTYYKRVNNEIYIGNTVPTKYKRTTEVFKKETLDTFTYMYNENTTSQEFSMGTEVSVGGVLDAFDVGMSVSTDFTESSSQTSGGGEEFRKIVEKRMTFKEEIHQEISKGECLLEYIPVEVFCYKFGYNGRKRYCQVPKDTLSSLAADEKKFKELSESENLLDEESFKIYKPFYPDIKLTNIREKMRAMVPKVVQTMIPGVYKIKTTYHPLSGCPADRYLHSWVDEKSKRNELSNWVSNQSIDSRIVCEWEVKPGKTPGTFRIVTNYPDVIDENTTLAKLSFGAMAVITKQYPKDRGLSAWGGHVFNARHDEWVIRAAAHDHDHWSMDWVIEPGSKPNTWKVLTTHHAAGGTEPGFGLAAWGEKVPDAKIDSEWTYVDSRRQWQMDWVFERQWRG